MYFRMALQPNFESLMSKIVLLFLFASSWQNTALAQRTPFSLVETQNTLGATVLESDEPIECQLSNDQKEMGQAIARELSPREEHSYQVTSSQTAGAQTAQEVTVLEAGKPIERELAGGQKHSYQVALLEGQYIRVEIRQLSIDVGLSTQLPDGKIISIVDIPGLMREPSFELLAESSGVYKAIVFARSKAPLGRYEIRIAQLRQATENDRAAQQARNLILRFQELTREGKYLEARPFIERALEIRERVLGQDSPMVAVTIAHLSSNHEITGDYSAAVSLRERALRIREKLRGPNHPEVAYELYALGRLHQARSDYLKAEVMYQKSLGIYETANQTESITVSYLLGYLGDINYERGNYANAEAYYERSRAIREKQLGSDHYHLVSLFNSLGAVAYDAGDYAKAEAKFQHALALSEKALGPDDLTLTVELNNLGMLYCTTGDYTKAEAFYRRALSLEQKAGMSHENVKDTLFGLARLYAAKGTLSEAVEFQAKASEIEEHHVELNLAAGSERERLAFLDNLSSHLSRNISLHTHLAPNNPAALNLAVTTILQRKGRAQDAMSAGFTALRSRFGPEDQELLDQLNGVTAKLAKLVLNGPQKATPAEHQLQIKKLETEREKLEGAISGRSAGFYTKSQPVTLAIVQAAIPDNAALVEFAVYRPYEPGAPDNKQAYRAPRYVAYVIRKQGEVLWKELGEAKEIDRAVDELRQALRNVKRNDVRRLARAVDNRVMQGVRPLVGDATQLLVSPDGALNLMPFEVLVDESGNYLIQRYSISYLTSGRDLLRMQVVRKSQGKSLIIANPSFGEPGVSAITGAGGRTSRSSALSNVHRGVTSGSELSDVYFAPLGITAEEGQNIRALFPESTLLTGNQANEASLKKAVAPRILHVASHGFFLTDAITTAATRGTRAISGSATIGNPLLRSGLALAGANLRNANNEDGILTALEASGLNLWGTKLVTLSACDTGLGEVKNGEGVYGLRRAFVLAGTETLVMSLWPVSDYVTRELMAGYYKGLKQGQGRGEALRQIQLDMLKRKGRRHPFYWASFIQSGEWANLDGKR